jgi:hypothetical protein
MITTRFLDTEGYGPLRPQVHDDYNFETQEGRDAFVAGRGLDTNDYPPNNPKGGSNKSHQAWKTGWLQAARCAGAA